jgi:GntR family transcriptional regulator, galactonate operon transcriptional repressor
VTRVHEPLAKALLQEILDGERPPGAKLSSEVQMSEERQVSRNAVRGAVEALRQRGILDVRHGVGQRVRPEEDWHVLDDDVLVAIMTARRLDLVREIVDCQAMLEPGAAALAAQRATDDAVAELAAAHANVEQAAGAPRRAPVPLEDPLVVAEIRFHRSLARMAGNRPLQRMLVPIGRALALARHELAPDDKDALVRALRRSLRAIEARDPDAARKSVEARVATARRWLKSAA